MPEVYAAARLQRCRLQRPRAPGRDTHVLRGVHRFAVHPISRLFSPPVAWLTSLFAIVAPPSLVDWSLVGVAEISVTLLAGATAVLATHAWRQTRSLRALAVFAFAIGFGFWVQQYTFDYLVAIAAAAWIDAPRACRSTLADLVAADGVPRWAAVSARLLLAGAIVDAVLGLHSFFTGGFTSSVFGVPVENIHPQKLWRISAVLFVIPISASWWRRARRRDPDLVRHTVIAVGAFLVGFSPYIVGRLRGGGASAPMRSANAVEMWEATRRSANEMRHRVRCSAAREPAAPSARGDVSGPCRDSWHRRYAGIRRSRETMFFHVFPLVSVALFLMSVAFVDAQSYRYRCRSMPRFR